MASGATVSATTAGRSWADPRADRGPTAAVLTVLTGPHAGRQVELPAGTAVIGRDPRCDVVVDDPLASKRHARLVVGEVAEVVDLGSANGTAVGGGPVGRAVLSPSDVVVVGETQLSVRLLPRSGAREDGSTSVAFVRSPVSEKPPTGAALEPPEPPGAVQPYPLPLLAMLAPLVAGVVLLVVTGSLLSLVFVLLSPVLAVAVWLDQRLAGRRQERQEAAAFTAALAALDEQLGHLQEQERQDRLAEAPSTADAVAAAYRLQPLLWCRRPDSARFLALRLGLGAAPARHHVAVSSGVRGRPEHLRAVAELVERRATLTGVPVVVPLLTAADSTAHAPAGVVGVAGRGEHADGTARALVVQLVALHSPAEVVVTATTGAAGAAAWSWLRWLPHTSSAASPLGGSTAAHLAAGAADGAALVARLEQLVELRAGAAEPGAARPRQSVQQPDEHHGPLPAVLLVVGRDSPVERSRLVQLAESGSAVGIVVLWCAAEVEALPSACRAVVAVRPDGSASAQLPRTGTRVDPVACETVTAEVAEAFARRLAPVVDSGARIDDGSDLPRSTALLDLLGGAAALDPQAALERWGEARGDGLRAAVGLTALEPFVLDLRLHGPHALVGGTTGSGKSEFLQSWVLALAAGHSPQRLTFLFVDYKGGSAFGACTELPHAVGLVTDLTPHLVRRALTSLRAELRHRERVLAAGGHKDLLTMERSGDPATPTSLVIVVDEFAALAGEVPEFVDGVVDVAQRGRSLGLHLVLATQRPAGVITGSLRANTALRIALRLADAEDSDDVVGDPAAAEIDPSVPGRALARSGPTSLTPFQAAYAGGRSGSGRPAAAEVSVEGLGAGGRPWPSASSSTADDDDGPTDVTRLVGALQTAAQLAELPTPRRPWLEPLGDGYDLADLRQRHDRELVLGMADDPDHQRQLPVAFHPDSEGNLLVLGTGGSGKSTALRTLAVAAAITPRGGPVHVHALDFAGGGLAILEGLPHVGSVVSGDDGERVVRLLARLRALVEERGRRYAAARASTITEYRELAGAPEEPRVLVLLDGLGAFREAYEVGRGAPWFTALLQVASDGRAVGVHLAVSNDRPGGIPPALASSVQRRLVLRLASEDDYALVDVPKDVLGAASPPGRGVLDGREVQVAVLGGSRSVRHQSEALRALATSVARRPGAVAEPVGRLPERVPLADLPVAVGGLPVLGVEDDGLAPVGFDPRGVFVVAGPPASGRTTALASLARSVQRWCPQVRTHLLSADPSSLTGLLAWTSRAVGPEAVDEAARRVLDELGRPGNAPAPHLVVVEDAPLHVGGLAETALVDLVAACLRGGHTLLVDGETSALTQWGPLLTAVRAGRRGVVLQPDQVDGDAVFRTAFPRVARAEFPPGRGLLVSRGAAVRVQVALPEVS
nr:FtsK/SpoIIIE domain-containing protein [Quadrisphaera sp. RL12-1S]